MGFQTGHRGWSNLPPNFILGLGILFVQGCSDPKSFDVRLAVPSQNEDNALLNPPLASTAENPEFVPWVIKEEGDGEILCSGEAHSIPFPIDELRSNSIGSHEVRLDGDRWIELELFQVSQWSPPPPALIEEADPPLFQQRYHSHRFFDGRNSVISLDRAIEIIEADSVVNLYPVERDGLWYPSYFEREVGYWLRYHGGRDGPGLNLKTAGVIDRFTGMTIDTGVGYYEKPNGGLRFRFNYPFTHESGLDLVFDLFKSDPTQQEHEITEGKVYSLDGFSAQVLLFREGEWIKKLVENEDSQSNRFHGSYRLTRVSDRGMTLFLVSDGSFPSTDWRIEGFDADGRGWVRLPRANQFFYHHYRGGKSAIEKMRLIRGPDRDRIVFHLPKVPPPPGATGKIDNLFDQTVPFFYAKDAHKMLEALSRLLVVDYKIPTRIPNKPEGFPVAMKDATVAELLEQLRTLLKPAGFGVELQRDKLQWEFPTLENESVGDSAE